MEETYYMAPTDPTRNLRRWITRMCEGYLETRDGYHTYKWTPENKKWALSQFFANYPTPEPHIEGAKSYHQGFMPQDEVKIRGLWESREVSDVLLW
jgi:hypothetical protein